MFDYPQHYLPFSWESSLAWKRKEKNFSLCPLCEFNDLIYDYKGGNVSRGTWRKPTEDKIIKQDIGNTLREKSWCDWARSWSTIKGLFFVLSHSWRETQLKGVRNEPPGCVFRSLWRKMLLCIWVFFSWKLIICKLSLLKRARSSGLGLNVHRKVFPGTFWPQHLIRNYLNSSFYLQKYFRI